MRTFRHQPRIRQSGQTLIAAMILLGVLLIVGFVFLGIVNRNILQSSSARQRSIANDLAEAGIRYMHAQMLYSASGADWRGFPTPPINNRDPDYDYLLPDPDANPLNGDQGGPDGLGAYTRVNQGAGRFLVRARYAPSDAFLFSTAPNGPLRQPGRARAYLILESVGRMGQVNPQDPTTLVERYRRESRKLIAFASIGMIESALYITNQDRVSRAADIGIPTPLGSIYSDFVSGSAPVNVPLQVGGSEFMYNFGNPPTPSPSPVPFGGSIYSNANLLVHGRMIANLNQNLGEALLVNGSIRGADATSSLQINRAFFSGGTWNTVPSVLQNTTSPSLDSRSNNFSTIFGAIRDEEVGTDLDGYWRAVGRKEAPSILTAHPESGVMRYYTLTRDSGTLLINGNSGRHGHGKGVYVNNFGDRQMRSDEQGRMDVGSAESLLYDWFNPNNGQANSGWIGPYYVPRGAYLLLDSGGWIILRDSRATGAERTWRRPDGSNTGSQAIRYRVGRGTAGDVRVVNSYTPGININANLSTADFDLGQPFNGVLYFEGNVRVRGVIPTDVQLTIVSGATAYIEGSITKGILRNDVTDPGAVPSPAQRLARPTRSMLMLMAKEYTTVNPTMFFGPAPTQDVFEVNESPSPVSWNPIEVATGGGTFSFRADMLLDPRSGGGPFAPNTWRPFAMDYAEFGTPANTLRSRLLLSHTAADSGTGSLSFVSLDVNFGLPLSNYFFEMVPPNSAAPYFLPQLWGAIYGLGGETWQVYPKFESTGFTLLDPASAVLAPNGLSMRANNAGAFGDYTVFAGEANDLMLRTNQVGPTQPQPYRLARTAVVPADIRIEAALYAEQGSFVIIPGHWVNPNPNDSREAFNARVAALQAAPFSLTQADAVRQAARERLESYGADADMPFYGEPMDVRVQIFGSVSQNMPLPMSYQAEWLRKWGWIPRHLAARFNFSGSNANLVLLPQAHVPSGYDITNTGPDRYVPNMIVSYDPALATASEAGFGTDYLRRDRFGRPLAPMPSLPVSPSLVYFGEVPK